MKNPNKLIHAGFETVLILKVLGAAGEVSGGIGLVFLTPERADRLISAISAQELARDPGDLLMNWLVTFGRTFSVSMQHFAVFYLLSHGAVKLTVLFLLWKKKLWAYPLSALVFAGFIVYQIRQFSSSGSVMLIILTVLDIAMIALTILEYRRRRAAGAR